MTDKIVNTASFMIALFCMVITGVSIVAPNLILIENNLLKYVVAITPMVIYTLIHYGYTDKKKPEVKIEDIPIVIRNLDGVIDMEYEYGKLFIFPKDHIEVGTILECNTGEFDSLTFKKTYTVLAVTKLDLYILDDNGSQHYFALKPSEVYGNKTWKDFFIINK